MASWPGQVQGERGRAALIYDTGMVSIFDENEFKRNELLLLDFSLSLLSSPPAGTLRGFPDGPLRCWADIAICSNVKVLQSRPYSHQRALAPAAAPAAVAFQPLSANGTPSLPPIVLQLRLRPAGSPKFSSL